MTTQTERDAQIAKLWLTMSYSQIAKQLGLSFGTVSGALERMKRRGERPERLSQPVVVLPPRTPKQRPLGQRPKCSVRLDSAEETTLDIFEAAAVVEATRALSRTEAPDVERSISVGATTGKKRREPTTFAAPKISKAKALPSFFGVPPFIDGRAYGPVVRAVLEARPGTCRFPVGADRDDFRFCGRPATVAAGGATTYCRDCARSMYQPTERSVAHRPAKPSASDRHYIGA